MHICYSIKFFSLSLPDDSLASSLQVPSHSSKGFPKFSFVYISTCIHVYYFEILSNNEHISEDGSLGITQCRWPSYVLLVRRMLYTWHQDNVVLVIEIRKFFLRKTHLARQLNEIRKRLKKLGLKLHTVSIYYGIFCVCTGQLHSKSLAVIKTSALRKSLIFYNC